MLLFHLLAKMAHGNNRNRFQALTPPSSTSTMAQHDSASSMDNTSNPFFLHSGDHLGLILVSHLLTDPNYNTWSWVMLMAHNAKHKLGFVDGSISQPPLDDPFVEVWPRCNNIVTSWLLKFVSKEIIVVYFTLTMLKLFGQIYIIGFIKATPHIFFRSSNNCMVCFKVPLISILFILVWKYFGTNTRIFNPFPFVNVAAWKHGWIVNNKNMWCNLWWA